MAQTINNMSVTWNDGGTTFTSLKMNVTDTASNGGSMLMDLQVGGVSKFYVTKNGTAIANAWLMNGLLTGLGGWGTITGSGHSDRAVIYTAGTQIAGLTGNELRLSNAVVLGWASNVPSAAGQDVSLVRDAAATLAQRNSTNAQTFRIYNTYTDASNYERGFLKWNTNVLKIGTEKAGTGTARALEFQTDGTTRLTIQTNGTVTSSGTISANGTVLLYDGIVIGNSLGYLQFTSRSVVRSPADGQFTISNAAENDFGRLNFGGTTSSFPALKRSSTTLQVRLADDSDYAPTAVAHEEVAKGYTVAGLPTPTVGMIARVTDANAPAVGSTVTGGAAAAALVWYNGSNWTVIGV